MRIDGSEYLIELNDQLYQDPLAVTMAIIGGKWKVLLLWDLKEGPLRFSSLMQMRMGITERMLSRQLKALQGDGLVIRKAYGEVPPRVEYELSEEGKTLLPVLEVLSAWGRYKGDQGRLLKVKD
jgi:DNA-binding HxlR family transcriptional regulator